MALEQFKKKRAENAEKSVFEKPDEKWHGESEKSLFAWRIRAQMVGRFLLQAYEKKQEEVGKAKPEEKFHGKSLQEALREHEVALAGLKGKKDALLKMRSDFEKRFQDFREIHKALGTILSPFEGQKREILLHGLQRELSPSSFENKKTPEKKEIEMEKKALEQLDERIAALLPKNHAEISHLAVYVFLKEEKIFAAEDQLNGTRAQKFSLETDLKVGQRNVISLLDANPTLGDKILAVAHDQKITDNEKLFAIDAMLENLADPKLKDVFQQYQEALTDTLILPDLQQSIRKLKNRIREDRERIERAKENNLQEKALRKMQIPSDNKEK